MKLKIGWVVMAIVLLSIPQYAGATSALEKQDFVNGLSGENYSFVADQTSPYKVTLTDLMFPARFDYLGALINQSDNPLAKLEISPSTANRMTATFDAELGKTYWANVLGQAAEPPGVGLFRIEITAVPVPPAVLLLGSGLLALFALKRKS